MKVYTFFRKLKKFFPFQNSNWSMAELLEGGLMINLTFEKKSISISLHIESTHNLFDKLKSYIL